VSLSNPGDTGGKEKCTEGERSKILYNDLDGLVSQLMHLKIIQGSPGIQAQNKVGRDVQRTKW
jgi:hypothetical protein